ncbi:uncharacterized protein isoform X2 [Rhodnius prolixus]
MKENYEAKLARLKNELQKLETLIENIEFQINKCNEEEFGLLESLRDTTNQEKLKEFIGALKDDRDWNKEKKIIEDNQENKPQKTEIKQTEKENANLGDGNWECPPFDLEQELMKLPILRDILVKTKKEKNSSFPPERDPCLPSSSTFRIYEFSSQDVGCPPIDNMMNTIKQFHIDSKIQCNEGKSSKQYEDSEVMKFVKRNCTSSALSNMYSLMPKAYSAPKGKPMARGVVKKGSRTEVAKVRFAENMEDTFSTCDENNNHRTTSGQNLFWYSGPYLSRNKEREKPCSQLFEYKSKNQRFRDSTYNQEPLELRSFLSSTRLDSIPDFDPDLKAGSLDLDGVFDPVNFDCFF